MSNNRITPFVKRMRVNGGTIYTFSSAVEDIGLNINERNNVVKISHFALLNIPKIDETTSIDENLFNVNAIVGAWEYNQDSASIKDGRVLIAESFQNYALNLEANLLNNEDYDATLTRTVSERVFWKWLKETGAIRWTKDSSGVWAEELDADGSLGYNSVVKYIGQVSAGNVRSDTFGTYNETYVLVPTSHGQMDIYFHQVEDANYYHSMEIGNLGENILGREGYTKPHPDGLSYLAYYDFVDSSTQVGNTPYDMEYDASTGSYSPGWWYTAEGVEPFSTDNAYLTDSSSYTISEIYNTNLKYDDGGGNVIEFKRSNVDCMSLQFDLDVLKTIYSDSTLTYDKMAIQYAINDNFEFNTVLIYYTVYNSAIDTVLGINLLGVLFIDAPGGNTANIGFGGIVLPTLEKIQSGVGGFGTSYSLRLNIKTDNMIDDTATTVVDQATSDQLYAEDWAQAFANLDTAVNILTQNNSILKNISDQYIALQETQTQLLNDVQELEYQVNDIGRDITGTANTIAMFQDGDDPLVDSSIYMKYGKVGIFNNNPQYPVQVDASMKTKDIILENAIRDTSGNIILGYGSPLQVGSSTNYRQVDIYSGQVTPAISIDTSNNITINGSTFEFAKYLRDTSLGPQFYYQDGSLFVTDVSGLTPDVTKAYVDSSLLARDVCINWLINYQSIQDASISAIAPDVSKGYVDNALAERDASLNYIFDYSEDVSTRMSFIDINKAYVDGSLWVRDISLNNLYDYNTFQDVSIVLKADLTYVDTSLNVKADLTYVDASLLERDISLNYLFDNMGGTGDAWNGLTKTDNSIGLGGGLSQNIDIDLSTYYLNFDSLEGTVYFGGMIGLDYFGVFPDYFNVQANTEIYLGLGNGSKLVLDTSTLELYDYGSQKGLEYHADYSANYTIRSLPDVAWVKNYIDASLAQKIAYGTPDSSGTGIEGNLTYDASYLYVCTSTNTWGRILLETGY